MRTLTRHSISIPASTEHLGEIRTEVGRLASQFGFTEVEVQDIQLCVDEACTNVIKHGYGYDASKVFEVAIHPEGNEFHIEITDSGNAFDQEHYREPNVEQRIKERKKGGVGVYLIRKLMDRVDYQSTDGRNHMHMVKRK